VSYSDIEGNWADGNVQDGFDIGSVGGWSGGNLNANNATNNPGSAFRITNRTGGSAAANTASGNGDDTLPAP
jgi:hypothetical protein